MIREAKGVCPKEKRNQNSLVFMDFKFCGTKKQNRGISLFMQRIVVELIYLRL